MTEATIVYDKEEDLYTIYCSDTTLGGPVISHRDLDTCKSIFRQGLFLSYAIKKMVTFDFDLSDTPNAIKYSKIIESAY